MRRTKEKRSTVQPPAASAEIKRINKKNADFIMIGFSCNSYSYLLDL